VESYDKWHDTGVPDPAKMPHALKRENDSLFSFIDITWDGRAAGDAGSNAPPSFIGNTINNLFFFKNRLGFLSDDNVIMSGVGDFFNFYKGSVLDLLDDDRIDVALSANRVETLRSSAIFDQALLVFGDQTQFSVGSGDSPLTPSNVISTPTTAFEIDKTHNPIMAGSNVYFVCPGPEYVTVREYYIQPDSLLNDAADVTAHVPRYIPTGNVTLIGVNSHDILFVHSDASPDKLFIYKYFWTGTDKVQAAWSEWRITGNVYGMSNIESDLYFVVAHGTEVCLEKMAVPRVDTGILNFQIHLDRLRALTGGTYSAPDNETTWTLPYDINVTDDVTIVDSDGMPFDTYTMDAVLNKITVSGDKSAVTCYFGYNYEMRYRLSEWLIRDQKGIAITSGRLQVRSLTLAYKDTGYFAVEVTPEARDKTTEEMTGVTLGVSFIGNMPLLTGSKKFLVMTKSTGAQIDIVSDSYLPVFLLTGIWEGYFVTRGQVLS
jgi:hypothetical protein